MAQRTHRGFSLMEVAVSVFIVAVLAAVIVPLGSSLIDSQRGTQTASELQAIYTGIVGDPQRNTFGYLGDVGAYPTSLMDLVSSTATGWNGPYITNARVDGGLLIDPFGGVVEYFQANTSGGSDYLGLISKGPNRASTNPNQSSNSRTSFTAGTYPWLAGYNSGVNTDNVVFPAFLDNAGLVAYQSVGTFSLNIFNFDSNALVNATVPGCPALYTVTVMSVPRGTADQFTLAYNPGGLSVDLTQGLYNVRVTSPLAAAALYQEQVSVQPGGSTSRTINLNGLDSSVATNQTLTVNNATSAVFNIDVYRFFTDITGGSQGAGSVVYTVPACSVIIVRRSSNNAIVDAFIMPNRAYTRVINTTPAYNSLAVTNGGINASMLKVYEQGLLIGTVSYKGNKKTKTFFNVRVGSTITFEDQNGVALGSQTINSMPASPAPFTKTVP